MQVCRKKISWYFFGLVLMKLTYKIFVLLGSIIVSSILLYAGIELFFQKSALEKDVISKHQIILDGALAPVGVGIWNYDSDLVSETVKASFNVGNLRKVLAFGEEGEYFAGNEYDVKTGEILDIENASMEDFIKDKHKGILNDFEKSKQGIVEKVSSSQIRLVRSIWNMEDEARVVGYVVLDFSTSEIKARLITIASRLGLFTLFLCGVILILAQLFIHALVVKRVKKLEKVSIEVSKRNYVTLEEDRKKDELASLSNNFNQMVSELKDYSSNLEKKVEERTKQVIESKKQIQDILDNIQQGIRRFRKHSSLN